jgi:hypothetical protein
MRSFIDRHSADVVPNDAFCRLVREAEEHQVESRGVRLLGLWLDDGGLYCVVQAADAESVRRAHAERGLPCDDLHELDGLPSTRPVSAENERMVRAAIQAIWDLRSHEHTRVGAALESAVLRRRTKARPSRVNLQ